MLFSFLLLGLFVGLKHALEADHVSTVATLASRSASARQPVSGRVRRGRGAGGGRSQRGGSAAAPAVVPTFRLGVDGFAVLAGNRRSRPWDLDRCAEQGVLPARGRRRGRVLRRMLRRG